jgi:hypothetical protein
MTTRGDTRATTYAKRIMPWLNERVKDARLAGRSMAYSLTQASRRRWNTVREVCIDLGWSPKPGVERLLERAHVSITSAGERRRIERELEQYAKSGAAGIDLLRAAALWAGAGSERYALRQMRYRLLAAAIKRGEIRGVVQHGGGGPGPDAYTRLPLRELRDYFIRIGVLNRSP